MKEKLKNILKMDNIISLISILIGIYFIVVILRLDVFPVGYVIGTFFVYMVFDGIFIFILKKGKKIGKIFGYILLVIFMLLAIVASYYLTKTNTFFDNAFHNASLEYKNTYYVIVKKESNYNNIDSLMNQNLSYYQEDVNVDKALEKLQKSTTFGKQNYQKMSLIVEDLSKNKIDFLLIGDTNYRLMFDTNSKISKENYKTLYQFTITSKEEKKSNRQNISLNEPFHVYIGGTDFTENNMDLNMILTINPEKHKVLLTSIPRDYYVEVAGYNGKKDTLSYMGSLGITTNKKSIENLFGIDIDYYLKFETTGLVKLVDEIGGINYCSEEEYTTTHALVLDYNDANGKKLHVKKGCQTLNGIETLTVAREKHAFKTGDRQRQKNCQAIMIDIIEELGTTNTIANYNNILNAISDVYETTLEKEIITEIIKDAVKNRTSWNFEVQSVNGTDAKDYVHMTDLKGYVMYPDNETVEMAKEEIYATLK